MVAVADTLKEEAAAESQAVSIAVVATAERLRAEQNAAEATVAEVAERLRLQREALEATADRLRMEQERLRVEVAVAEQLRAEHEAAQAMVEWLRCEREAADMNVEQLRAEQGAVEAEEVAYYTQRLEEVRAQLSTSGVPSPPAAVAAPACLAEDTLFALCLDAPKDHITVPCGHQCVGKAAVAGWRAVQPLPGARAEAETNDGSSSEEAWTDEDDAFDDWVPPGRVDEA